MVRSCGVDFQCHRVLLIWIIEGQGPTALAVGAYGGVCLVYHFPLFISLSLMDDPIQTEILSQRAVQPKTIKQPTN